MVYSWCWLGIWVLAGSGRSGCNELLEVVCGLGEVVDLQGVDDWGSGSWFEGFRVVYVAMRSKAGVYIGVYGGQCGSNVQRSQTEWHFEGFV